MIIFLLLPLVLLSTTARVSSYEQTTADLILTKGGIFTQDRRGKIAQAAAIKRGRFVVVGSNKEVMRQQSRKTRVIDLKGRSVIPGLNDSHLHAIRGGRFYNAELRWDGVPTLQEAVKMIHEQAERTPEGQWVRVVGAWSPYQFAEKRMPTLDEINEASPDRPVFVLHLFGRGFLNRAALEALGIDRNTVPPPGSTIEKDADGEPTGLLIASPNPTMLVQTIGTLPMLSLEDRVNSTQYFYRELYRFGLTSVIDAGVGDINFLKITSFLSS